jgi:hypothetical protein
VNATCVCIIIIKSSSSHTCAFSNNFSSFSHYIFFICYIRECMATGKCFVNLTVRAITNRLFVLRRDDNLLLVSVCENSLAERNVRAADAANPTWPRRLMIRLKLNSTHTLRKGFVVGDALCSLICQTLFVVHFICIAPFRGHRTQWHSHSIFAKNTDTHFRLLFFVCVACFRFSKHKQKVFNFFALAFSFHIGPLNF